jgi:uncharacterized protein
MISVQKPATLGVIVALTLFAGCAGIQRAFLFHPTHHHDDNSLTPWINDGAIIGYSRQVLAPKNIWLMLHGNGGQAAGRAYAIGSFSNQDSVFVMEYPGYGARSGKPAKSTFDAAAVEAYLVLIRTFPASSICVAGESIGSGPASMLATQPRPPDKIVLIVPFDTLKSVASEHFPLLPVGAILGESWDNVLSLSHYKGPIEIFGAEHDTIIPIKHAEQLSKTFPSAKFHQIASGHNDWWRGHGVEIQNP